MGNQARDRLAMAGDDNLLPLLNTVQKSAQGVLRLKGGDLIHDNTSKNF